MSTKGTKRTKIVVTRMTTEELDRLQRVCETMKRTRSSVIRGLVNGALDALLGRRRTGDTYDPEED